jgi:hypothetical protein
VQLVCRSTTKLPTTTRIRRCMNDSYSNTTVGRQVRLIRGALHKAPCGKERGWRYSRVYKICMRFGMALLLLLRRVGRLPAFSRSHCGVSVYF